MNSNNSKVSTERIRINRWLSTSAIFASGIVVVVVCIFLSVLVTPEIHDVRHALDVDCLHRHLCPTDQYPSLNAPLPPLPTRPIEALIWSEALNSLKPDERDYLIENKRHFEFEVRRTIFEFEKGSEVNYPYPTNNLKSPHFAHALARQEVLLWYQNTNLLPPNFQPDAFD